MKIIVPLVLLVTISVWGNAQNQTFKTYIQQIAANKIYIEYLQKGYKIAKKGLTTISDIKGGHWRLDQYFFNGLQSINPKIRRYTRVLDIITLNGKIIKTCKIVASSSTASSSFDNDDINYIRKVSSSLMEACTALNEELAQLLTANLLKMSDDERLKRIDLVYTDVQERYSFANSFLNDINLMIIQRKKESKDVDALRNIFKN